MLKLTILCYTMETNLGFSRVGAGEARSYCQEDVGRDI
jgi:hypothetical protein